MKAVKVKWIRVRSVQVPVASIADATQRVEPDTKNGKKWEVCMFFFQKKQRFRVFSFQGISGLAIYK